MPFEFYDNFQNLLQQREESRYSKNLAAVTLANLCAIIEVDEQKGNYLQTPARTMNYVIDTTRT